MFGLSSEKQTGDPSLEDHKHLLADDDCSSLDSRPTKQAARGPSWTATIITVFCTAAISAACGAFAVQHGRLSADDFSIRHTSQYSPIIKDVGVKYSPVKFEGSLMKTNDFRLDAGPEVDAAWKSLGADYRAARIPAEEAARSNLAPDQVKISERYGGGYPANVEGLHHLHCLNLLRKSLAWNFDYYQKQGLGPFSNDAHILKHHVTHCLDIIRQQLMCTVDVGVLGQVWYQPPGSSPEAFVDFNTVHKCRNFDAVRDWAEKHQLPDAKDCPIDYLELPKEGDRIFHTVP
ncbi:tat pathway signal sequence [Ampelomyces quisqualis]|uniref:Tat pathway signal sequence n=1 Tax=Ampelomyces quisqualis TaxID=50730 RepID=A0A6A5Q6E6_AMPQU|nr:tat pathway signal sequence [Ampelomyces quisqualis]